MKPNNPKELIGKKVKVIQNGAGVPQGIVAKVIQGLSKEEAGDSVPGVYIEGYPNSLLYMTEIENTSFTKEDIRKDILLLEEKISELKSKEQFIIDNNLEEFDETQYKVFKTLQTLDNEKISDVEKSKLIAELIKK